MQWISYVIHILKQFQKLASWLQLLCSDISYVIHCIHILIPIRLNISYKDCMTCCRLEYFLALIFWMIESVPCHEYMVGLYLIMIMLSRTFVLILLKCLYKVPIATSQWASLNFSFSFQVLPFVNGQILTSLSLSSFSVLCFDNIILSRIIWRKL